ncbi:MAG: hypothetical protein ACK55I_39025, partial [bacterium]
LRLEQVDARGPGESDAAIDGAVVAAVGKRGDGRAAHVAQHLRGGPAAASDRLHAEREEVPIDAVGLRDACERGDERKAESHGESCQSAAHRVHSIDASRSATVAS